MQTTIQKITKATSLPEMLQIIQKMEKEESPIDSYILLGQAVTQSNENIHSIMTDAVDKEINTSAAAQEIAYNALKSHLTSTNTISDKIEMLIKLNQDSFFKFGVIVRAFVMLKDEPEVQKSLIQKLTSFI